MDGTSIGDRMKRYEHQQRHTLLRRTPAIVRVDGRGFHRYTRQCGFARPFCDEMAWCMAQVADALMGEMQGAKLAYVQSDEVSVLLTDYDTLTTEPWFGGVVQKMASVAASIATAAWGEAIREREWPLAQFDARVFSVPREEVCNYFIWRQQDATRNSIQMLARAHFTHKECHGKNGSKLQDMLMERGVNWNDTATRFRRGACVVGGVLDSDIPIFTQDRSYVERFVEPCAQEVV